jgi:exopolysaccharide biosynthesis protein
MKIKYFFIAVFTTLFITSCSNTKDNSDYSDWLGQKYNQTLNWDPDSMAFMRANWSNTELENSIVIRQASKIKMWNTMQTVTLASYPQNALVSNFSQPNALSNTSDQGVKNDCVLALNGSFFDASGKPTTFVMVDKKVLSEANVSDANGLIAFNDNGETWNLEIKPFSTADIPNIKSNYTSALEAGPLLVYNNEIQSFPQTEYYTKKEARSIIGTNTSGNIVMAVIDGNIPNYADGVTIPEAATIAKLMGMVNAVSLTGGNSSTLWHTTMGILNYPSGNGTFDHEGESAVSNIVLAKKYQMFAGGDGSEMNPYLISTAHQMNNIRNVMSQSNTPIYFKMTADVDMSGIAWVPFNLSSPYQNKINFDGKGYTISNFTCSGDGYPSFAGVVNGIIKNVNFVNAKVEGNASSSHVGIIGGYLGTNGIFGEIENVSVQGTVNQQSKTAFAGGLVGNFRYGSIKNCYVDVNVTSNTSGDAGVGGICGYQYDGKNLKTETSDVNTLIANNYFTGTVVAPNCRVGGILGKSENRWGNWLYNNISEAKSLKGLSNLTGLICGVMYPACIIAGRTHDNYASRSCQLYWGDALHTPAIDTYYNEGNTHHGIPLDSNASAAAKKLGWDEAIWNLSGTSPRLKIMK